MSRINTETKEYILSPEGIDLVSENISSFCESINVEKRTTLHYRLSIEESLLDWLNSAENEEDTILLTTGTRLGRPYIRIECTGSRLNPFQNDMPDEFGIFTTNLLRNLKLSPDYSYVNGKNILTFRIQKKKLNPIITLSAVILLALAAGGIGLLCPDTVIDWTTSSVISPISTTFFEFLRCLAGPMIFFSVAWGIYGIGDAAMFGTVGKKLLLRFVAFTLAASCIAVIFYPLFGPELSDAGSSSSDFSNIFEMLLDIIPPDIVTPFKEGNTLQIVFLAFITGIALLLLGKRTPTTARAVDELNATVQFIMEFVSRLIPAVIFLMILKLMWSDTLSSVSTIMFPLLALAILLILLSAILLVYTSVKFRTPTVGLLKKGLPSFTIALTTASSTAAFDSLIKYTEQGLGINRSLTQFGVPLGMVICRPATAISFVLVTFYFADMFNVETSYSWILTALIVCGISAIATPMVPGGAAAAYSIMISQLGIPSEALALILTLDVFIDFITTAFNLHLMSLQLLLISDSLGSVDYDILEAKKKK